MSGREEFDWDRMRRDEDDYFAARNKPPGQIAPTLMGVMTRAARGGKLADEAQAVIDTLCAMPYPAYLQTDHWQAVRTRTLERDGHRCRWCASRRELNVHHLNYERRGQERAIDVITLCRACHVLAHADR